MKNRTKVAILMVCALAATVRGEALPGGANAGFHAVDPAYRASGLFPGPYTKEGAPWLYGDGEFEAWQLQRLFQRSQAVCSHVGYPGVRYEPSTSICFRLPAATLPASLQFRAVGDAEIAVDGVAVARLPDANGVRTVAFEPGHLKQPVELRVTLTSASNALPALLIEEAPCSTALGGWQSSLDSLQWASARPIPQVQSGQPPHLADLPTIPVEPVGKEGNLYDFGRTLLGTLSFSGEGRPRLYVGESMAEARLNDKSLMEQKTGLTRDDNGVWRSNNQLAFRYVRIEGATPTQLKVDAVFRPAEYRGSFTCSDEKINQIWAHCAYTLRCCMNHLMLDGIKRDRLPWIGDQAANLMANAYTFADAEIIRQTVTALGRNGIEASDINGIVDYSCWWIIVQDMFQLYFDDPDYLQREWPRIQAAMEVMQSKCDADGFLVPREKTWLFIDWGIKGTYKSQVNLPLQTLWYWALRSGSSLAERGGHDEVAESWRNHADSLAKILREKGWNKKAHGYSFSIEEPGRISRHGNLLAVLSGLATETQLPHIRTHLLDDKLPPVVTPYMTSLEVIALSRLGATDAILPRIHAYWGTQLDHGATTFWEKYDPARPDDLYSMYKRPFANSLCHAWGSGPAALLPAEILGIRPLEDGWRRFSVDPHPGSLEFIRATVPTPHGSIVAEIDGQTLSFSIPAGTTAVFRGEAIPGPEKVQRNLED